ncbi:hypothetical protein LOK49_LG07G03460 [Camellia lanceoleosa]|uniref:Uncharacterized protein n=1 Tax=Camellia lanceoleosa TaxID=1840588 RepID=A0ACC0H1Y3_9ERIC|nr:hypothetical protein LOK49_LG07G03460 [Camellia lanceoleosa]
MGKKQHLDQHRNISAVRSEHQQHDQHRNISAVNVVLGLVLIPSVVHFDRYGCDEDIYMDIDGFTWTIGVEIEATTTRIHIINNHTVVEDHTIVNMKTMMFVHNRNIKTMFQNRP